MFEILTSIAQICDTMISEYDTEGKLENRFFAEGYDDIVLPPEVVRAVVSGSQTEKKEGMFLQQGIFVYAHFQTETGHIYILGPFNTQTEEYVCAHEFRKQFGKKTDHISLKYRDIADITKILVLTAYVVTGQKVNVIKRYHTITDEQVNEKSHFDAELTENQYEAYEKMERHLAEMNEREFEAIIENGDIEKLKERCSYMEMDKLKQIGRMADKEMKQLEYAFASSITIARMAAVRGGMDYEFSCRLSDMYYNRLEKTNNMEGVIKLMIDMQFDYTTRVAEIRKQNETDRVIERCKNEITKGVSSPFDREELAKKVGYNPNYLSMHFHEVTGMTMQEYRMKKRLSAAANMLKYSAYSIVDIANRFQFCSSSNFCANFKKEYGMTPSKYRSKHASLQNN